MKSRVTGRSRRQKRCGETGRRIKDKRKSVMKQARRRRQETKEGRYCETCSGRQEGRCGEEVIR